jgi:hypothetical protein
MDATAGDDSVLCYLAHRTAEMAGRNCVYTHTAGEHTATPPVEGPGPEAQTALEVRFTVGDFDAVAGVSDTAAFIDAFGDRIHARLIADFFEHVADLAGDYDEDDLVSCDGCDATSEDGWGDTALCLDCSPADEVCAEHQRTFHGTCPLDHDEAPAA